MREKRPYGVAWRKQIDKHDLENLCEKHTGHASRIDQLYRPTLSKAKKSYVRETRKVLDFFLNKENSEMATASRHWFWLVLVAGSHANP
jgi:hypothetical protein